MHSPQEPTTDDLIATLRNITNNTRDAGGTRSGPLPLEMLDCIADRLENLAGPDTGKRRWVSVVYSPKRVAIGVGGGTSHVFLTHPNASPDELRADGRLIARALNESRCGREKLLELVAAGVIVLE